MAPTRDFSVYLLRDGFDATTCLKTDNGLQAESDAASLPDRATLYIMDGEPHDPWWKKYFEIRRPLLQVIPEGAGPVNPPFLLLIFSFGVPRLLVGASR